MFDTVNTQPAHYTNGCFRAGSGPHVIIVHGSCRIMPYVNYFHRLNSDGRFTICVIDIVNFAIDPQGKPLNAEVFTQQFESNPILLDMVKRCRWFVHEHAENFGIFNTAKTAPKNIYQLGLQPELDISIPNFNDRFILEHDYTSCGMPIPEDYVAHGESEVLEFCKICEMSSFPEMAEYFRENWRTTRFFWRPNHVSAAFSMYVFKRMAEKFLILSLSNDFLVAAGQEDLFREPHTDVTQRDIDGYKLKWA